MCTKYDLLISSSEKILIVLQDSGSFLLLLEIFKKKFMIMFTKIWSIDLGFWKILIVLQDSGSFLLLLEIFKILLWLCVQKYETDFMSSS